MTVYVVGGVGLVLLGAVVVVYNRFVAQRQLIANSWATVDTELRRRYDLIPNLVAAVKGYAAHERDTLRAVVESRARAVASTGDPAEQAGAENVLVDSLRHLLAVAEVYPDLRASAHFADLQDQLVETEDRIQAARRIFNGNVRDFNRRVEQIPTNLVARLGGFERASYFGIDTATRAAVPVAS